MADDNDGKIISSVPRSDSGKNRTDQAALMGAALAAIIALVVSPGSWEPFSTIVGISLLMVLIGYYRPAWHPTETNALDAITKALALAAVSALCICLAVADYVQDYRLSSAEVRFCRDVGTAYGNKAASEAAIANRETPLKEKTADIGLLEDDERGLTNGNCLGGMTTAQLPKIWMWAASLIFISYLIVYGVRLLPGNEPSRKAPIGLVPIVPRCSHQPRGIEVSADIPIGAVPRIPKGKG